MEQISSRKNQYIVHVRALASDGAYRRAAGEYLCDGIKTLREALSFGAEISSVLWKEQRQAPEGFSCHREYVVDKELFDYASVMKNSPGPLFTVKIPHADCNTPIKNAIVLENVQDPGNVGTVIRTANAFGIDAVILCGDCADLYNPKTVRSTMGAIFRQRVLSMDIEEMGRHLRENGLKLYGAALSDKAESILKTEMKNAAFAVGSEGHGLSRELLSICDGEVIIPMRPDSESLNAAVAASILMWEMWK